MESNGERGRISEQERSTQGLAITSLVLGILSVFLSVFLVGGALAVIGFIFGAVHLIQRRRPRLMAWFGTVLSVFGILATSVIAFAYFQFFSSFLADFADADFGSVGTDYSKWEGVMAPDITVTTLEGETITLSELKGRRVVLDFWATWCPPCREEIPHFIELTKELDASDLLIVGISDEDEGTIQSFLDEMPVNYPMVSADNLPAPFTNIAAIPTTFFIDRNGVIQSVQVGYHDLNFLRELATAEDFQGTPLESPREASDAPQSGLLESDAPLTSLTLWSLDIPGVDALCVGDWDADGVYEILYQRNKTLHIVGLEGTEEASLTLPDTYSRIEMGWHKEGGPRLLGEIGNGDKIQVMDESGKKIWSYDYWGGIDGAHWGDLDGDGTDEMILGMNGFGGLHALSAEGKRLWRVRGIANVWNQAVIPAGEQPAMVFATEAGGTIRVFDGEGKRVRTLHPLGDYYAGMTAAVMDAGHSVQLLAIGNGRVVVFDPTGAVAWHTPTNANWVNQFCASGDLDGDGTAEWVFFDDADNLVVASIEGVRKATIENQSGVESFAIAQNSEGKGILVTLQSGTLTAYGFK